MRSLTMAGGLALALAPAGANAQQSVLHDRVAACISQSLAARPPTIVKFTVTNTPKIGIAIVCSGAAAKSLFGDLQPIAVEVMNTDSTNAKRVSRLFGQNPVLGAGSSQCYWTYEGPDGRPVDDYVCDLVLDFSAAAVSAL